MSLFSFPRRRARKRRMAIRRTKPVTRAVVKRIVRSQAELKFKDLSIAVTALPTVLGNLVNLTAGASLDQGDGVSQRNGNWIQPVSMSGHVLLVANAANTNEFHEYKVMIVQWMEDQGVANLTLAKIVDDTSDPYQGQNIQNKGQFRILWSRTGLLSTNPDNSNFQKLHKFNFKLPARKILYSINVDKANHIFMVGYSGDAAAAEPCEWRHSTRIRYTDS